MNCFRLSKFKRKVLPDGWSEIMLGNVHVGAKIIPKKFAIMPVVEKKKKSTKTMITSLHFCQSSVSSSTSFSCP